MHILPSYSPAGPDLSDPQPLSETETPMDGGPLDPRFHEDKPNSDVDIVAMDVEKRGGEPLPTPTRYDVIMRQLSQALNERESDLRANVQ